MPTQQLKPTPTDVKNSGTGPIMSSENPQSSGGGETTPFNKLKDSKKFWAAVQMPWFMVYMYSRFVPLGIIMSPSSPKSISIDRSITFADVRIPGGYPAPQFGGFDAKRVSFQIQVASFNNYEGISFIMKQFEMLQHHKQFFGVGGDPFDSNPRVLMQYGLGGLLQSFFPTDVKIKVSHFNDLGIPQVAEIDLSLTLDEDGALNIMERQNRQVQALLGIVKGGKMFYDANKSSNNPYIGTMFQKRWKK